MYCARCGRVLKVKLVALNCASIHAMPVFTSQYIKRAGNKREMTSFSYLQLGRDGLIDVIYFEVVLIVQNP